MNKKKHGGGMPKLELGTKTITFFMSAPEPTHKKLTEYAKKNSIKNVQRAVLDIVKRYFKTNKI